MRERRHKRGSAAKDERCGNRTGSDGAPACPMCARLPGFVDLVRHLKTLLFLPAEPATLSAHPHDSSFRCWKSVDRSITPERFFSHNPNKVARAMQLKRLEIAFFATTGRLL
jgi:hypothetical protein